MSQERRDPTSPLTRLVVGVLLAAPFVALLWVPSYAKDKPRLFGFPFFYWYQLAWVIITGLFIGIAYTLTRRPADDRDKDGR